MAGILAGAKKSMLMYGLYHLGIFLVGLGGLLLFYRQSSRYLAIRVETDSKLKTQGDHLQGIVDNISSGIAVYDVIDGGGEFYHKKCQFGGSQNCAA